MGNQLHSDYMCGLCGHPNEMAALTCDRCGEVLAQTTRALTASLPESEPTQITSIADTRQGIVSLYIQGRNLPVKVDDTAHIVLGRRQSLDDTFVTVDLSSAEAHRLGVSRRHAVIRLYGEVVTIEDLNSSNGTFINERRLEPGRSRPLLSGDKLRLGKLVILFVYHLPRSR